MRTNHDVSAASIRKFVEEGFRVFVNPCSSVKERHKTSIRSHKLHYLKREFFFGCQRKKGDIKNIYGTEGE